MSESCDNTVINFISYDDIRQFILYDHIICDGIPYYILGNKNDIPDKYVPFSSEIVYVTLVDAEGDAYDKNRKEEGWLYQNDNDRLYIYFGSMVFTKDKRLASNRYGFND